jgi:hypothetical protein
VNYAVVYELNVESKKSKKIERMRGYEGRMIRVKAK